MTDIDLRSDTVTLPTKEMREAIAAAELGDDVFGEDPTVNRLQEVAAAVLGKEAGLLVTSGTQGNLVSLLAQTRPGEEALVEAQSHIYNNESAGISRVAGLIPRTIPGRYGALSGRQVEEALRPADVHFPRTSIVCLENTHNTAGGTVITPEQMREVATVAREHDLKVHVDGARIFNAAVALETEASTLAEEADSLTFCLSKGLCCPAGSVVVGSQGFIEEARRARKLLGGGMRQAGIMAAAGIVALDRMVDRLSEDHANARYLAEGIARMDSVNVDLESVQTNIVIFDVSPAGFSAPQFASLLGEKGLRVTTKDRSRVRCVTHYGIDRQHIERALEILTESLEKGSGADDLARPVHSDRYPREALTR
ncbi:MAG: GntG family PLP-dependent aldolase [Thermoplasmata archaeon]